MSSDQRSSQAVDHGPKNSASVSQPRISPGLERQPKSEATEVPLVCKEKPSIYLDSPENLSTCLTNYKGRSFDMEQSQVKQTGEPDRTENNDVNVTDVPRSCTVGVVENDLADAIETSSSFGDTVSLTDNSEVLDDVQSQQRCDQTSISEYKGYHDVFRTRNKKLTAHWRRFIRPIMWRCKWMELQIKKLQSQASAYDRELAQYDIRKNSGHERSPSEEFDAKSHPFRQCQRNKAMKRNKRKRVEDTVDLVSYMSHHNFFSYYENNKSFPESAAVEVDSSNLDKTTYQNGEFGTSDGLSLEFQDGESSFEALFRRIEVVQSRVRNLILRVDKVVAENAVKIAYMSKLSIGTPCDAPGTSGQNSSLEENRTGIQVESHSTGSRDISEQNVAELLMIDGAVSSHGDVTPRSKITVSVDQLRVRGLFENNEDGVLIDNEQAKEEMNDFEKFRARFGQKPLASEKDPKSNLPPAGLAADSVPSKPNPRAKGRKRKRKTYSRR